MSSAAPPPPAPPADTPVPAPPRVGAGRRKPGRRYVTEAEFWTIQATAERPFEWKCGLGLSDDAGEELGELLPRDGYDEDGNPAMPTYQHNQLLDALLDLLRPALEGTAYEKLSQGMAVRASAARENRLRYPDVLVLRTPPRFEPHPRGVQLVLQNPVVLIEILSDSTEAEDLTTKLGDYASIPSVTDYLIVAQDERLVLHYSRPAGASEADGWHVTRHGGPDAAVTLADPAVTLSLADLYARVLPA